MPPFDLALLIPRETTALKEIYLDISVVPPILTCHASYLPPQLIKRRKFPAPLRTYLINTINKKIPLKIWNILSRWLSIGLRSSPLHTVRFSNIVKVISIFGTQQKARVTVNSVCCLQHILLSPNTPSSEDLLIFSEILSLRLSISLEISHFYNPCL